MRKTRYAFAGVAASLAGCTLLTNLDGLTGGSAVVPGADARASDAAVSMIPPDAAAGPLEPTCGGGTLDPRYLNDAVDIAVGNTYACAVRVGGTVACWGLGAEGELGRPSALDGDGLPVPSPRPLVVPGLVKINRVSAGYSHACAIDADKHAWCWGSAVPGDLGSGSRDASPSGPVMVVDKSGNALAGVTSIGAGDRHTCAVVGGGAVACWGSNVYGQVGDGNIPRASLTPSAVMVPGVSGALAIASGEDHSCAVVEAPDRRIVRWGLGTNGQLGTLPSDLDGGSWYSAAPVTLPLATAGAGVPQNVSAGYFTTCVVDQNGNVFGTGDNRTGQLGSLSFGEKLIAPSAVQGLVDGLTSLTASGDEHTCAIRTDKSVVCIGRNRSGQLGRGYHSDVELVPSPVIGFDEDGGADAGILTNVVAISIGGTSTLAASCAIVKPACAAAGTVVCWGANNAGELGTGVITDDLPPVRVIAP